MPAVTPITDVHEVLPRGLPNPDSAESVLQADLPRLEDKHTHQLCDPERITWPFWTSFFLTVKLWW